MSTQNDAVQNGQDNQPQDLESYLKDPLSLPEGVDPASLFVDGDTSETSETETPDDVEPQAADDEVAQSKKQSDTDGGSLPTEAESNSQDSQEVLNDDVPAGIVSRDGKHIIPYQELSTTRERALRAEAMLEQVMAENNALKSGSYQSPIISIEDETLDALREDAPETAELVEKLIASNRELAKYAQAAQGNQVQQHLEQRVQAAVMTEDAISQVPKLAYVRVHEPATFAEIAQIDTLLGKQTNWQGKPLVDRFNAAVRAYEAVNGELAGETLPAQSEVAVKPPVIDEGAQVKKAIKKAVADTSSGINTLSDIPAGVTAPIDARDALTNMSSLALTQRFMNMTADQIEAELARLT